MSIIHAKNFSFTYPGIEEKAIDDVSFEIEAKEIVGLIGPVGAGKTTLCMAIAGFVPSVTGGDFSGEINVNVNDRNSSKSSNGRRNSNNSSEDNNEQQVGKVGMVFEDFAAQLTHLEILNELITPLTERGVSQEDAPDQARELLKKVGLDAQNLENRRAWELSGGQQLRLAFAAVLALDPPIFILDNLLDKLDPWEQDRVIQIVKDLGDDKTVIIVEQNITLLHQLVDRFLVLVDGKVTAQGKADEILRNHDVLSQADILPPVPLRIARDLGLSEAPLTPEEFEQAIGQNKKQDNNSREEGQEERGSSPHATVRALGLLEYDKERNDKQLQGAQHQKERKSDRRFGQPVLCIQDLTYCYDDDDDSGTNALKDVNITVREGEVHGVIGRSGAGKSTLIELIAGLIAPSEGKICICDVDTRDKNVPDLAMMVGTALQNPDSQLSEKTVRGEIGFPLKQRQHERTGLFSKQQRYDDDHIKDRVSQVSKLVGVEEELFDRDPFLLPRGQRQLVAIAEALMVDPKVLLLDEPGMGLGETSRHKISELLEHLRDQDKAVLLAGNDIDFIANIADTVTILDQGRVVLQGSVHEVFAEENWEQLSEELHLQPPSTARLAKRVGVDAVKYDELVSKLSSK